MRRLRRRLWATATASDKPCSTCFSWSKCWSRASTSTETAGATSNENGSTTPGNRSGASTACRSWVSSGRSARACRTSPVARSSRLRGFHRASGRSSGSRSSRASRRSTTRSRTRRSRHSWRTRRCGTCPRSSTPCRAHPRSSSSSIARSGLSRQPIRRRTRRSSSAPRSSSSRAAT